MKAAIYLRVSTGRQATADHVSLSVQEQACRAVYGNAAQRDKGQHTAAVQA